MGSDTKETTIHVPRSAVAMAGGFSSHETDDTGELLDIPMIFPYMTFPYVHGIFMDKSTAVHWFIFIGYPLVN